MWKTSKLDNPAVMSQKFSESLLIEDRDCELNTITPDEPCSSKVIGPTETMTGLNIAQWFTNENKNETIYNIPGYDCGNPGDFSGSDEESFEDWDDFELEKPKQRDKVKRKHLKQHMRHKCMVRYKSSSIAEFDKQTKFLLHRLVVARYINRYSDIAGAGSHSIVINGRSSSLFSMPSWQPTGVVVKVYENNENSTALYGKVQNEYQILEKIYRCHINGPKPACAWRNIIVMGRIGEGRPAPSITMAPARYDLQNYYDIVDSMKKMYQIAKVVHGNLSQTSILWFECRPYFIGWSHSVPVDHPKALNLLIKDCFGVTSIFQHKLKLELKTTEELFKYLTDLPEINSKQLIFLENIKMYTISRNHDTAYTKKCPVNYANILQYCAMIHR